MVGQRCDRRGHAGGLRDSSFPGLCRTCGSAPASGHLRLFAGWPRLRAAWLLAPTGNRTDLCDFPDDRGHRCDDGGRRCAAVRPDRHPRGRHGGPALLIAWLLRLSMLVRLISDSILVGFKAGAGLTIAMTQMPSLLGVTGGGHNFFERTA